MKTLTIKEAEQITGCENIEMFGIKTEKSFKYEFKLDFSDSNFGKKKGWIKDENAKWDSIKKVWSLKTNYIPRHLISLISNIS